METFVLDPRCWRIGRIFGRNPLLRRTDRIEALVTLVALVVSLVAIPVAGVVGACRSTACVTPGTLRRHMSDTRSWQRLLDDRDRRRGSTVVQARWPVAAGERTGPLQLTTAGEGG